MNLTPENGPILQTTKQENGAWFRQCVCPCHLHEPEKKLLGCSRSSFKFYDDPKLKNEFIQG